MGYLHPLGRLSLAVDFPTEGHVYHFQKVKANAVLDIKFSDPKIMQHWIRIGIFAAIVRSDYVNSATVSLRHAGRSCRSACWLRASRRSQRER